MLYTVWGSIALLLLFRFATGIEFREGSLLISPKCALQARKGISADFSIMLCVTLEMYDK